MADIQTIDIRGARVHNLKDINVSVPLHQIVGIAGVSGSGKSSLALGVLYAEGSRRYLDSLSTYTRRRMTMASKATVDEVLHVPAALALRQRPGIAGIRSTFGTSTELLNSLRLMFSRLASHVCPNGHHVPPSLMVAAEKELVCPTCGARFYGPSAEDLSFNGAGACPSCSGTGIVRTVDRSTLVPDENLTIEEGAVVVWGSLMWSLMVDVCREMGVRTNVPFKDLTDKEKKIVFEGPAEKKHILYKGGKNSNPVELDFTYFNAVYTVENALAKVKDESGMKRVAKFLKEDACPDCGGTGKIIKEKCPDCYGTGFVTRRKKIKVTIPAGIDNGQSLRDRGNGEPGINGGERGDLLVEVIVSPHPIFKRQDTSIYSTVPISFAKAALGGPIRIKTVDGEVEYEVKAGTQTDTKVRLKGKGVPSLRNRNIRGDHFVTLVVQVPERLNEAQKEALRRFDDAMNGVAPDGEKPKKKGLFK